MDALKFLEEFDRMCVYYKDKICRGCPREGSPNCIIAAMGKEERAKLIRDVEQWIKEHPKRTRSQDFLEKYPDAEVLPDGQPVICCARLGYREYCGKSFGSDDCFSQCRDCWNTPVEEDK